MSKQDLDLVLSLLPKLSSSEKSVLLGALKMQGIQKEVDGDRPEAESRADLLFLSVSQQVAKATGQNPIGWLALRQSTRDALTGASRSIDAFIDRVHPGCDRDSRYVFYQLFSKLSIQRLEEVGAPVTIKGVAHMHESFPGLLDRAFPGYAAFGAIGWLVKDKKKSLAQMS